MLISLQELNMVYRAGDIETTALNKINVDIEAGEFVAVMGPSGCGKSTFLNVTGMLQQPSSGRYLFKGENVARYTESKLCNLRKANIGIIFQSFNLFDELTVFENVELALLYHKIPVAERRERVHEVLTKMGISHRTKHMPSQLSGGQQQRVAVARAVATRPALILADEPTGNLDSAHGKEVMDLLHSLNSEGTTIIMVTHSTEHAQAAQRVIQLFDGKVAEQAA